MMLTESAGTFWSGEDPATHNVILADWDVPGVQAFTTLRTGGLSQPPYASWNLGQHVGDEPDLVEENRKRLQALLSTAVAPTWLHQVHGNRVIELCENGFRYVNTEQAEAGNRPRADYACVNFLPEADASMTRKAGVPCVVMTADCLPVVLAARDASVVAVAHAGWRGLAAGVLEETAQAMLVEPGLLNVWLGPAIGPKAFEVGQDVVDAFVSSLGDSARQYFVPGMARDKFLADLYELARLRLQRLGVQNITGGTRCTFSESEQFFSYRRDGITGRMATLVMIQP